MSDDGCGRSGDDSGDSGDSGAGGEDDDEDDEETEDEDLNQDGKINGADLAIDGGALDA